MEFTQGNPLTITVLVGQALRDGLTTRTQVEAFVARLRAGAATITDDAGQGRDRSLGASLNYGLDHAFTAPERAQLALLHLFQGFINVNVLCWMGDPDAEQSVPEVLGLTREAGIGLLDRAAEIGLLTRHGAGFYSIHPALPWFFQQWFTHHYGPASQQAAMRAYTNAVSILGNSYHNHYEAGRDEVIVVLRVEEVNLLHARALARSHGWWPAVIGSMQGLTTLYGHTGRAGEWRRLVDELVPDLVNPDTDGPLPDREEQWPVVTRYRVELAIDSRDWATAERLQQASVTWHREQASAALAAPAEALDDLQRNRIRSLVVGVQVLGHLLRKQQQPGCVLHFEEAILLLRRIGARHDEAVVALSLGHAYKDIPGLRDLDQAEHWYRTSLELFDENDELGRGRCVAQVGGVALERFEEVRSAGAAGEELLGYLNRAIAAYRQALDLFPQDAVNELVVAHNQLGTIYAEAGDLDTALIHYRQAIHYEERGGDRYDAGQTRFNVAIALFCAGRLSDALLYAQAAFRDFKQVGAGATADIDMTQQLITRIQQHLTAAGSPSP
ncbi:MAG: tetratricopeptide repeat protein [Egibacteraceae bacterium]